MAKYKPLDLSFIAPRSSAEAESVRHTARMIAANAGWGNELTFEEMKAVEQANKDAKAANRQTALSSLFDLLSTPLYGVANAMDEALAGHQSDNDDSVLDDIGKTVGGVFTGGARGIGAGLRGATGLVDFVPGVDINDEWQSNKSDKTHFSDVAIRQQLKMSTGDAMKPENWDTVKTKLDAINQKSMWDKTFFELAIPDDLNSPDAREEYFRNQMLTGIASDIGGDPLNLLLPGIGAARRTAQVSEGLTEGLDAARAGNAVDDSILKGLGVKAGDRFPVKSNIDEPAPIGVIGETPIFTPKPKSAAPVAPTPEIPGLAIAPEQQARIAEQIVKMMNNGGGWFYRVGNYLNHALIGIPFDRTFKFLDEMDQVSKTIGTLPSREELVKSFTKTLSDDVMIAAGHSVDEVEEVASTAAKVDPPPPVDTTPPAAIGDKGKYKTLAGIGRREIPKQGIVLGGADQAKVTNQLFNLATSGKKNWLYEAAEVLRQNPKVQWTRTEELLDKASGIIKRVGPTRGAHGLKQALREQIALDVKNTKVPVDVERRLSNTIRAEEVGIRTGPQLASKEAQLANRVVRKFENEILGGKRAPGTYEGLARAIASGANVRYSGPQQARMWNEITTNLHFRNPKKFDKAVRILRSVEDYFISKGMIPHSAAKTAESAPLRLSEVAEALGPQFLGASHAFITGILRGDPKALAQLSEAQIDALTALRAKGSVEAAPAVNRGIAAGKGIIAEIDQSKLSAGRAKELINKAIDSAKLATAKLGGGDAGARVTDNYLSNLTGRNNPVEGVLRGNKLKTEAWLGTVGKRNPIHGPRNVKVGAKGASKVGARTSGLVNDPSFVRSVTNAISRASDLPPAHKLGGAVGQAALVKEWLGARFNAAYGVKDMRPIYLREQGSALSRIGRRTRLINNLAREFDPKDVDLWHEAMRLAQENGVSNNAKVAKLQSEIAKVMENLFGGTGLRSGAIADSTVIGRNRLLLDELNSNLRRFGLPEYQFIAKKVKDETGQVRDFSKGVEWMKSWELWNIKDPYKFLHQVQNAVDHTVHEKLMFDEIISRFASPKRSADVKYGVNHPRLRGYFFTEEGARQAQIFVKMLEEVSTPNAKSLQYFDNVLSKLKASLTIYIPGHHWTNLIGDLYFNWIAGVNKPIRYEQAMKVMLAQKGRYGEFAEVGKRTADDFEALTGPRALEEAVARSVLGEGSGLKVPAKGNQVIVTMQNGTKVTADMIMTSMVREGVLPSARVLEEVASDVSTVLDKFRPLGGRGQRAVHAVSEIRDHIPRIAQYIDGLTKSKGSFLEASRTSARSVRKWHPDGIDLTKFERNFMKRVFPFYSWTRKAIPLAIESVIFAGPKVMAYPRLMEAIALSNGISPNQNTSDPFPNDQMFPDWLRDRGIGPVMGGPGSYRVINPSTPVLDIFTMLGHPGQSMVDMLNPMVKVPIETGQGQTLGRNVPIGHTNEQWLDYAAKQIPVVSQAGRASGQFGVSESTKSEGFPNYTNILNLLTGAKAVDTGKYQRSAQFDLRDYFKKKAEQNFR